MIVSNKKHKHEQKQQKCVDVEANGIFSTLKILHFIFITTYMILMFFYITFLELEINNN